MRPIRLATLAAGLAAAAALAPTTDAQAPAGGYGSIKGQVTLPNFPPPGNENVAGNKDAPVCLAKGALPKNIIIVNAKNSGLKNVVVYLRPDDTVLGQVKQFPKDKINPALVNAKPKHHVIDQPCCQFEPRVVAGRAGDTLEIKNSATISHNINYGGDKGNDAFNAMVLPGGTKVLGKPIAGETPAAQVPFKCDIHPWMAGRLFVFDHPYFALTDADGKFEIKDAPAGDWRLVYRHEEGFYKGAPGRFGEKVTVKAGGVTEAPVLKFEFAKK